MKARKVRLQNFRCFRDQTVDLGDYTCLVGPGGVGKSTILTALRIFFRDTAGSPTDLISLQDEDFHKRDTSTDVVITVTFSDLEAEAQKDFAHYFRQEQLVVSAIAHWNEETRSAEVKQFGERLVMGAFGNFFKAEADGSSVAELKSIYAGIAVRIPNCPRRPRKRPCRTPFMFTRVPIRRSASFFPARTNFMALRKVQIAYRNICNGSSFRR